ncbi:PIG-L deacetylase family protein [Hansschlegelia quercus]|uniref:PIG-L family deacetylase n=1 Tax=Hansschlegelia quercus TaxID=2528245 RepID=A0A4Q9GFV5_9HYPH|nr:PIG-L deacetylase family protein [Hansschlegelia quercus]TBN51746.1 PIG-L family deacetylase [Hansschlegelia quercus]
MISIASLLADPPPTLVIAPHPDDEALGCGGLIAALATRGGRVRVAFVTDGGASHPASPTWSRERLAACREEEAKEALRRLGLGEEDAVFLRLPDAAMPASGSAEHERALGVLAEVVNDLRPSLALLPWRRDPHCDHRDSWALAMDALEAASAYPTILEYAIWLDELGSEEDQPRSGEAERVDIDVSATLAQKRAAVTAHVSQLGELITDDPTAFRLTQETVARLTGDLERYWRPCAK